MYSGGFTHLQSPPFPGSPRQTPPSQSREAGPSMERPLRPPRHFSAPNLSQVLTLHLSKYCWRGRLVFAASMPHQACRFFLCLCRICRCYLARNCYLIPEAAEKPQRSCRALAMSSRAPACLSSRCHRQVWLSRSRARPWIWAAMRSRACACGEALGSPAPDPARLPGTCPDPDDAGCL